jgi:hypothetical protein
MNTLTIDNDNNISAFATKGKAAAASTTPFDTFTSEKDLAELAAAWPAERLVAVWNSLAGVTPVERFKNRKTAIGRIWARIQSLGESAAPSVPSGKVGPPTKPKEEPSVKRGAQAAKGAPAKAKATRKATPDKKASKGKKAVKAQEAAAPREGSKTSQVVAMLQRKSGATLAEIMELMGWQKHTVRGFIAGAMKKAGYAVESFKSEGGERTYRII